MEVTKEILTQWIHAAIEGTDLFLISLAIKPGNQIQVILDSDKGLIVDDCIKVNRFVLDQLEQQNPDHEYGVDVSSPGAEFPLKMPRQFTKHIGRKIEVSHLEGISEGYLKEVSSEALVIEDKVLNLLSKKKKKPDQIWTLDKIKSIKVLISFK